MVFISEEDLEENPHIRYFDHLNPGWSKVTNNVCIFLCYHIRQNIRGGKLSRFLLDHEYFTLNSLLAIGIHYQKELLPQKFSCEHSFSILTVKVSP